MLKAIGLLGAAREPHLFSTGPEYLNLVTYLGCSPQISLGEGEAATRIRLRGIFPAPQFLHGDNLKAPRCQQCREVQDKLGASAVQELHCSHCGHHGALHSFDWRRSAGFGRVFIEISNVFESEAVPAESLTEALKQASGEAWDYCYVRKNSS